MPWFKVDDGIHANKKVLRIPRSRRCAAMGLWLLVGTWATSNLTDGLVPDYIPLEMGGTQRMIDDLVTAELWMKVDDGHEYPNWEEYQPTRGSVEEKRTEHAEKMRLWREAKKAKRDASVTNHAAVTHQSREDSVTRHNVTRDDIVTSIPTRPDPTRPVLPTEVHEEPSSSETASGLDDNPRPEVVELCEHLAEKVEENGHRVSRPIGKNWIRACRLLIDVDGRAPEQVRTAIDWATADPFWSTNIRSMQTLREKYTTLQAQARQPRKSGTPGGINWETAAARAAARTAEINGRASA